MVRMERKIDDKMWEICEMWEVGGGDVDVDVKTGLDG